MIVYTPPVTLDRLPVIDLGPWLDGSDRAGVAAQLHAKAQKCGFFYIANYGIPDGLMASMLDLAERFFKLPAPVRMQVEIGKSTCRRGYEPMQYPTLDLGSPPDLKERFFIGEDFGPEHPYVKACLPN